MTRGICLAVAAVIALSTPVTPATAQPAPKRPDNKAGKRVVTAEVPAATLAALSGADVEAAVKAAEQLGASPLVGAHEALLDALALGVPPSVATPAMLALGMHPAPPDVSALKRYAGHHTPSVRSVALTTLAMYPDPIAQAAIVDGLKDPVGMVRTAAAGAAGKGHVKAAVESLIALLAKGEDSSARALAQLADPELARKLADQLGKVPDPSLALALGAILKRLDFGPDEARTEIVRAIAKIQDPSAITALTDYLDGSPKSPPRTSRTEAQMVVEARLGGGK